MKTHRILILILVLVTTVQASPHRRVTHHHSHPYRYSNHYRPAHYNYLRYSYGPVRYYQPAYVTRVTKTVYPKNLVTITAEAVTGDIETLHDAFLRDLISENDYKGAKKTLLNRIGMQVNPEAVGASTQDIITQIEHLYEMKSRQVLTEREYRKQKNKLLDMI
ncbi:MAG: hypothetical protein K9M49_01695 [Candidatus Marinimicrobia bacterium]|nr:hypothetical protein [Candidatus Neomarinimicrobiota bacterium]MCF7850261.1 hypothetical protein [Candidatus Neomarinimicrobiota bacterium]MCF7903842.1 hypothetical protein [Candidatus Neomarinimicrobiota bacterium]